MRYINNGTKTVVFADVDGDAIEDFAIQLNGHKTLTADDFNF